MEDQVRSGQEQRQWEEKNEPQKQSLGRRRVRTSFNPSANSLVDEIKRKSAELIDLCDKLRNEYANKNMGSSTADVGEVSRLFSLAQTHYEDAAMWAVKAATV